MAETVKSVVLQNSIMIEKFFHPLFSLHFVPFLLGTFIVLQLLKFLRFSVEVSSKCSSNTDFCGYTVRDLLTVVQKVWDSASDFFYLYVAYEGVRAHGLKPRAFLPLVGIATFFTLLQWILTDIIGIGKEAVYNVSATTTTNFLKYTLDDAVKQFSANYINMTFVFVGAALALHR